MIARLTVGELRDLLAGLCCPLCQTLPAADGAPCRVSTASARADDGGVHYVLAVEIPPAAVRCGGERRSLRELEP